MPSVSKRGNQRKKKNGGTGLQKSARGAPKKCGDASGGKYKRHHPKNHCGGGGTFWQGDAKQRKKGEGRSLSKHKREGKKKKTKKKNPSKFT